MILSIKSIQMPCPNTLWFLGHRFSLMVLEIIVNSQRGGDLCNISKLRASTDCGHESRLWTGLNEVAPLKLELRRCLLRRLFLVRSVDLKKGFQKRLSIYLIVTFVNKYLLLCGYSLFMVWFIEAIFCSLVIGVHWFVWH